MAVPTSELQKINPSNVIELFELQLDSTIHGSTATYRWHNGISENNADIVFGSNSYTRLPIEADGFAYDGKQLPRPKLRASNINGTFTALLATLPQGLEGAKVTRIRTLERYIDDANFDGGDILLEDNTNFLVQEDDSVIDQEAADNPHGTPDPTAKFPDEIFYIDRKTTENRSVIEFELAASFDLHGVRVPKRQVLPADFPGIGTFYS
tara:strand:- start:702 stop:1328 length:627 start_codon:yes stop_codon:yes gene_type:complete